MHTGEKNEKEEKGWMYRHRNIQKAELDHRLTKVCLGENDNRAFPKFFQPIPPFRLLGDDPCYCALTDQNL